LGEERLPAMYVVSLQGLLFGSIGLVSAIGLLGNRSWARRMLLVASVALALSALVAIGIAPQRWDTQGVLVLFCACLWWEARKWHQQ
jgi:uncharacterized membrane protein